MATVLLRIDHIHHLELVLMPFFDICQICQSLDMEYLAVHFWVGIWLAVIATVVVALEGSVLVRYVSRFTQDIFALLISLIFIYESLRKIYVVSLDGKRHAQKTNKQTNTNIEANSSHIYVFI